MIVGAAVLILVEAWHAFRAPRPLGDVTAGVALDAGAGVHNAAWCAILFRAAARLRSPALGADARHLFADFVSSAGTTLGVGLAAATGWARLDPLLAVAVALNVVESGRGVIARWLPGLMDAAVPPDTARLLRAVIADASAAAVRVHDLKARHAGVASLNEFHPVVPGDSTVARAHAVLCARPNVDVEPEHEAVRTEAIQMWRPVAARSHGPRCAKQSWRHGAHTARPARGPLSPRRASRWRRGGPAWEGTR